MPQCTKCPNRQARLNAGNLCVACHKREAENEDTPEVGLVEIAGIPIDEIESMPALSAENLNQPITAGMMLKMLSDVMKPIHDKLNDHENRINSLEQATTSNTETIDKVKTKVDTVEQKLVVAETKIKNLEAANEKFKKVVTKQQSHLATQDKNKRMRNVVFAGLSEGVLKNEDGNDSAVTDEEKVDVILETLGLEDISFTSCRRTGNKDQGPQARPRFLIVEFQKQSDRNTVRAASHLLGNFPHLKDIRIKADLNKAEREEYKRLYDMKDQLIAENPTKKIEIDKGVLRMDGKEVDKYKPPSSVF